MNVQGRRSKRAGSVLSALALTACSHSSSPPSPVQADVAWIARGEFCEPETVLPLPDDTLLVSNVCGFASAGDGYLSLLDAQGRAINWKVIDGLDSPLGMTLRGNKIYVVDANRVKSFSWPGLEAIDAVVLDTEVANDIAASPRGDLYVTDTAAGRVIVVGADGEQKELASDTDFQGANGIEVNPDGELYVGGERLWRVDIATGKARVIGPQWLTDVDGIEFESNGAIQITPVGGPLVRLRQNGPAEIFGGEGISSANHGYAENLGLALIPTGYDNTVIAIRLPQ
jgi:DNA-binding beta-propeller fold protein YncE